MAKGHDIRHLFSAEDDACLSPGEMRAYLQGQGSPAERRRVELHLLNCELCSMAYEDWQPGMEASTVAGAEAISEAAWARVGEKKRRRGAFVWISVAASVMLLITTTWWVLRQPSEEKMEEVFAELMDQSLKSDPNLNPKANSDAFAQATPVEEEPVSVAVKDVPVEDVIVRENVKGWSDAELDNAGPPSTAYGAGSPKTVTATPMEKSSRDVAVAPDLDAIAMEESVVLEDESMDDKRTDRVVVATKNTEAKSESRAVKPVAAAPQKKERQEVKSDAWTGTASGKDASKGKSNAPGTRFKESAAPVTESYSYAGNIAVADSLAEVVPTSVSSYQAGMEAYRNREFQQSALLLRKAATDTPQNLDAHLHAAISFLNISQPQAALYHLERVLAEPSSNLREDAEWYKALAYLRMNEARKAKSLLESISKQNGKHAPAARKALEDLH